MVPMLRTFTMLTASVLLASVTHAETARNPFLRPLPATAVTERKPAGVTRVTSARPPLPALLAVLQVGEAALANIDGRLLAEGERIDGFLLVAIGERAVVVQRAGVNYRLALDPDEAS